MHLSHFAALSLYAFFASIIFGITLRDTPVRMAKYAAYCFALFVGSVIIASWAMWLIAR
jgi:hypothetical protein